MTEKRKPIIISRESMRDLMLGKIESEPYSALMSMFSPSLLHDGEGFDQVRLSIMEAVAVALGVISFCCSKTGREDDVLEQLISVARVASGTAAALEYSIGVNKYEQ